MEQVCIITYFRLNLKKKKYIPQQIILVDMELVRSSKSVRVAIE